MIFCLDEEIFVRGPRSLRGLCESPMSYHSLYFVFEDRLFDVFFFDKVLGRCGRF